MSLWSAQFLKFLLLNIYFSWAESHSIKFSKCFYKYLFPVLYFFLCNANIKQRTDITTSMNLSNKTAFVELPFACIEYYVLLLLLILFCYSIAIMWQVWWVLGCLSYLLPLGWSQRRWGRTTNWPTQWASSYKRPTSYGTTWRTCCKGDSFGPKRCEAVCMHGTAYLYNLYM